MAIQGFCPPPSPPSHSPSPSPSPYYQLLERGSARLGGIKKALKLIWAIMAHAGVITSYQSPCGIRLIRTSLINRGKVWSIWMSFIQFGNSYSISTIFDRSDSFLTSLEISKQIWTSSINSGQVGSILEKFNQWTSLDNFDPTKYNKPKWNVLF